MDHRGRPTHAHANTADYSDHEREFLMAMDRLVKRMRRQRPPRLPAYSDVLREAVRLGYRRLPADLVELWDRGEESRVKEELDARERAAPGRRKGSGVGGERRSRTTRRRER